MHLIGLYGTAMKMLFFVRKLTKEQKQLPLGGVYPVDFVRLLILNEDCNSFPEKYWSEMEK